MMTAYILRIRYPHGQSISAVMGRRPFWPPNWDAAGTPIVAAFDRRVPFIGFVCCVAATGKVNVLTLMAVSESMVLCARGEGCNYKNSSRAATPFFMLLFCVFHIILGL